MSRVDALRDHFPPCIAGLIDSYGYEMKEKITSSYLLRTSIHDLFLLEESGLVLILFDDNTLQLWDPSTKSAVGRTIHFFDTKIRNCLILPGDLLAVIAESENSLYYLTIIDTLNGDKSDIYESYYDLQSLFLLRDGKMAVIDSSECGFLVFDLENRLTKPVFFPVSSSTFCIENAIVLPDGKIVYDMLCASGKTNRLRLIESDFDEAKGRFLVEGNIDVLFLESISRGRIVFCTTDYKITVRAIDSPDTLTFEIGPDRPMKMKILLDDTIVTIYQNGSIKQWDSDTGTLIKEIRHNSHRPKCILFLPDLTILTSDGKGNLAAWE